jgi:hydrogenase expression/formation protein HypC
MCLGIPGQITEITDAQELRGIVDVAGARREIQLNYIVSDGRPVEACVGEWVLVHVGFAMSTIDEREAEATLRLLAELGEMQQEMEAMQAAEGDFKP